MDFEGIDHESDKAEEIFNSVVEASDNIRVAFDCQSMRIGIPMPSDEMDYDDEDYDEGEMR
jgi:hypothetical protein